MIISGTLQITSSSEVEWCQSGSYSASVLPWRYFQANSSVSRITGTMTISISTVAVTTRLPCWAAISPAGFNTTALLQPARLAAAKAAASQVGPRSFFSWSIARRVKKRARPCVARAGAALGVNANYWTETNVIRLAHLSIGHFVQGQTYGVMAGRMRPAGATMAARMADWA